MLLAGNDVWRGGGMQCPLVIIVNYRGPVGRLYRHSIVVVVCSGTLSCSRTTKRQTMHRRAIAAADCVIFGQSHVTVGHVTGHVRV